MSTPTFDVVADSSRSIVEYRITGVALDDSGKVAGVASGAAIDGPRRPEHRQIRSSDLSTLAAQSTSPLTAALRAAFDRKRELDRKAKAAEDAARAARWPVFLTLFLVPSLRAQAAEASRRAEEARRLTGGHVARFSHEQSSGETVQLWDQVVAAGLEAMRSQSIWDITSQSGVNQRRERTSATTSVTRTAVQAGEGKPAFIEVDRRVLRFGNANGQPMFLFPTFLMIGNDPASCVLLDLRELKVGYANTHFRETQRVPGDAKVISQAWQYSNKDGSRDKRFKDNRQIPIVHYAELSFQSASGLDECYMLSNVAATEAFAGALKALIVELQRMTHRVQPVAAQPERVQATEEGTPGARSAVAAEPKTPRVGPPLPGRPPLPSSGALPPTPSSGPSMPGNETRTTPPLPGGRPPLPGRPRS